MYDKPKVTIDLDEYNELLKAKQHAIQLDKLELTTLVVMRPKDFIGPLVPYQILERQNMDDGSIVYVLSNGASLQVLSKNNHKNERLY